MCLIQVKNLPKMQNISDMSPITNRLITSDKDSDRSDTSASEIVKKLRLSVTSSSANTNNADNSNVRSTSYERDTRDTSNSTTTSDTRDQVAPTYSNNCDSQQYFHASLVGDKYLLLDQVDGSSLYRCVNVHTQQELVCKVCLCFVLPFFFRFSWKILPVPKLLSFFRLIFNTSARITLCNDCGLTFIEIAYHS